MSSMSSWVGCMSTLRFDRPPILGFCRLSADLSIPRPVSRKRCRGTCSRQVIQGLREVRMDLEELVEARDRQCGPHLRVDADQHKAMAILLESAHQAHQGAQGQA